MNAKRLIFLALCAAISGCSSNSDVETLAACQSPDDCAGKLVCVNNYCMRPVFNAQSCASSDAWCVDGTCDGGVCISANSGDGVCNTSADCGSAYRCVGGKCTAQASVGGECADTNACARGECIDGICKITTGPGMACDSSRQCPAMFDCHDGVCLKTVLSGGDCRSSLTFCKDGDCVEGMCRGNAQSDKGLLTRDSDGDTIVDYYDRCDTDTDGDTTPDCLDLDSDGDTIPDELENHAPFGGEPSDSDYDGIYDFLSLDSDANGIPDAVEGKRQKTDGDGNPVFDGGNNPVWEFIDTDGDTILDSSSLDNDGDGIPDAIEIFGPPATKYLGQYKITPIQADCNGDAIPDEPGTLDAPFDCDADTVPDYLSADSDGDTILDIYEYDNDSNLDGFLDRYSLDSDSDGLPDSLEKGPNAIPAVCPDSSYYEFQVADIDNDGLIDGLEVDCGGALGHSKYKSDTDGDGFGDASEYAAAVYVSQRPEHPFHGKTPADFICNPGIGASDIFDFYFNLPYGGAAQDDTLLFKPAVSKLDIVFNVDTTNSMGDEVKNLQARIKEYIIPEVRNRVGDSAFGVSRFDDFPTRGTPNGAYDYLPGYALKYGYGRAVDDNGKTTGDTPFQLLGKPIAAVSGDDSAVALIVENVDKLSLHNGGDLPEAGYESLYQLVKADDKTRPQTAWYAYNNYAPYFENGSLPYAVPEPGRWGGAQFRDSSLPVVIHITDTTSHDKNNQPYDPATVENPHYSDDVHDAFLSRGVRLISIYTKSSRQLQQLVDSSNATNTYVPVCAFQSPNADGTSQWRCGENKCCTTTAADGSMTGVPPVDGKCVLSYSINKADALSTALVDGVDATVKYATYGVAAIVRGEPIPGTGLDTSCFIKRVEAVEDGYIAPPQQPEKDCNPKAIPTTFGDAPYRNGYASFAPGTSSAAREGAKLSFKVIAQNDTCVKSKTEAQVFRASIDIVDPTTKLVFGTREVSIIVPGKISEDIN